MKRGSIIPIAVMALLLLALQSPVMAQGPNPMRVGPEFSGQWYNPGQPGHGLLLEVLPGGQAFGAWFVFDDMGNPMWMVGMGRISGSDMTLDMQALSGGRFPPHFDAGAVQRTDWGTLVVHFDGCSSATLSWDSRLVRFGSGSMALRRLTSIDQLGCGQIAAWGNDLAYVADQIRSLHPDPFHVLPEAAFDGRVENLRQRLAGMPEELVPVAVAELLASLGDAHTTLMLPVRGMRHYPLQLSRVREGLIVTAAETGFEDLLGRRLMAIDGVTVADMETSLARVISHENPYWVEAMSPGYMMIPEVQVYLGHVENPDMARFRFQSIDGDVVARDIPSMPFEESPDWHGIFERPDFTAPTYMTRDDDYWYRYMDQSHTIYLSYHRARQMPGMSFNDMAQQIEAFSSMHPVDRVIVDLRFNHGGNSSIMESFIEGIPNSPFNSPERLFVLIGRDTFSSGLINALELRQKTHATLVGGPTGGKPDHFGEVRQFAMPSSGFLVTYSTRRFTMVGNDAMASLVPDLYVNDPSWLAFLHGEDPCLEAVGAF